jgi:retron-type reverse transcriptase
VVKNKGAPGVDGLTVSELKPWLQAHWSSVKQALLAGEYMPSAVRKVEIPKPQGGVRTLGIPTVLDRLIQQALHQVLQPCSIRSFLRRATAFVPDATGWHRFCRYADDCNSYIGSERTGQRAMSAITAFLEQRLKLKVNVSKSAVARPWERKFLGYSMTWHKKPKLKIAPQSRVRLAEKIRLALRQVRGQSLKQVIEQLNPVLRGGAGFVAGYRLRSSPVS